MRRAHIRSLDYFRAISIICIVAGHCYGNWQVDTWAEGALVNLITGGAAFFVFISGFFFDFVFMKNFNYAAFLKKKSKSILIPYLVLSFGYFVLLAIADYGIPDAHRLDIEKSNLATVVIMRVLSGDVFVAYWFIPFIMLVFVLSPAFVRFANIRTGYKITITVALLAIAMFIHRPTLDNPVHSLLYFSGYYCLGILYSQNKTLIDSYIAHFSGITFIAICTMLVLMNLNEQVGNLQKSSMMEFSNTMDLMVPLKLLCIAGILNITERMSRFDLRWLSYLANISFALFFIHDWARALLIQSQIKQFLFSTSEISDFLFYFAFVMMISIFLIELNRKLLGRHSKYITGY